MAITLSGDGISSDAIASLSASKLTGQVPDANAPSGSVIQVVSTAFNPGSTTTTSTWVAIATMCKPKQSMVHHTFDITFTKICF